LREPAQQVEEPKDMMDNISRKVRGFFGGLGLKSGQASTTIQEESH